MNRLWLIGGLLAVLLAPAVRGAAPPGWAKPYLQEDLSTWGRDASALVLLSSREVRYLSPDKVETRTRWVGRILNENGRDRARVRQPYNANTEKIVSAGAWVISADGKKTQAFKQKDFVDAVMQYNAYFWNAQRFIGFDASSRMEIGGVLIEEYVIESAAGITNASFSFLQSDPLVHGVFEVIPAPGGRLEWHASSGRIPPPVAGRELGALRWEVNRLGTSTAGRPAQFLANPLQVSVRCTGTGQASGAPASWQEFAQKAADIVEPRMVVAPEIKAKAEALIAGKLGRWERIRALADFIQDNITYLAITLDKDSLAGYRPHLPAEVLRDRYGDCKDKASLLSAMLRAVGDKGYVMFVHSGNPRAVIPEWPSASFNHAIVVIPADDQVPAWWPVVDGGGLGRLVVFDATDPVTPLGVLSADDQGGHGLVVSAGQTGLVKLPVEDPANARIERRIRATLDGMGQLQAHAEEVYSGTTAAAIDRGRDAARKAGFTRLLEVRLHETLPLVQNIHWSDQWEADAAHFHLKFDFATEKYARRLGENQLMFNPQLFAERSNLPAWTTSQEGVVWRAPRSLYDTLRLTLPEGFAVEEVPEDWKQSQAGMTCEVTYRRDGRDLVFECGLSSEGGFIEKAEYEVQRRFVQKAQEMLRRPVILERTSVPPK